MTLMWLKFVIMLFKVCLIEGTSLKDFFVEIFDSKNVKKKKVSTFENFLFKFYILIQLTILRNLEKTRGHIHNTFYEWAK